MPPVGSNNNLTAGEIAVILNHEKASWGNNARQVTPEEIQKIMDALKARAKP